jgi:hypothetical protein
MSFFGKSGSGTPNSGPSFNLGAGSTLGPGTSATSNAGGTSANPLGRSSLFGGSTGTTGITGLGASSVTTGTGFGHSSGITSSGGTGSGFTKSLGSLQNIQSAVKEEMTLEEINNDKSLQGAIEQIKDLNKKVAEYSAKAKPIDGADTFEKRLNELEEDMIRGLKHTIATLASEVDHGNSVISEYQDSLETSRRDIVYGNRNSTSSFLIRFVDSIQKRDEILREALHSFKRRLESDEYTQSPKAIVQVLQQQHEAIVRAAARVEQLRDDMSQVKRRVVKCGKSGRLQGTVIENVEEGEQRGSILSAVNDNYVEFRAERNRDLEKRHTNVEEFKTVQTQQSGFSFGKSFGSFGQKN